MNGRRVCQSKESSIPRAEVSEVIKRKSGVEIGEEGVRAQRAVDIHDLRKTWYWWRTEKENPSVVLLSWDREQRRRVSLNSAHNGTNGRCWQVYYTIPSQKSSSSLHLFCPNHPRQNPQSSPNPSKRLRNSEARTTSSSVFKFYIVSPVWCEANKKVPTSVPHGTQQAHCK